MAKASNIFSKPKPKGLAAMMASPPPPPDDEAAEGEGDEEVCDASITSDDLKSLKGGGTITITADDGRKIALTLKETGEETEEEEPDEGTAPEGM